jgi:hypothetical protein
MYSCRKCKRKKGTGSGSIDRERESPGEKVTTIELPSLFNPCDGVLLFAFVPAPLGWKYLSMLLFWDRAFRRLWT